MASSRRSRIQRSAAVRAAPSSWLVGTTAPFFMANLVALNSFGQNLPEPATHSVGDGLVGARVRAAGQGEPHRVGAIVLDPLQRIDGVALRLGHLLAVLVTHQAVQRDGMKRHLRGAVVIAVAYSPNIIIRTTQKNRMS